MKKILTVDDDPLCNWLMQQFLDKIAVPKEIQTAINGAEAVRVLNNYTPDIIFLDLNMPVMDGFEFLEAFKKLDISDKEKVQIVIVTSSEHSADMDRAKKMGAKKILSKPITVEQLQSVIN